MAAAVVEHLSTKDASPLDVSLDTAGQMLVLADMWCLPQLADKVLGALRQKYCLGFR